MPGEPDVVPDRGVQQSDLLRHQRDSLAHRPQGHVPEILTADADRAAGGVDSSQQQLDQGRLAGPAGPDDRHNAAGLEPQRHVRQGRSVGARIGDGDPLQFRPPSPGRRRARAPGRSGGGRSSSSSATRSHPAASASTPGSRVARDRIGRVELDHHGQERHQPAQGEPTRRQCLGAEHDDRQAARSVRRCPRSARTTHASRAAASAAAADPKGLPGERWRQPPVRG